MNQEKLKHSVIEIITKDSQLLVWINKTIQ